MVLSLLEHINLNVPDRQLAYDFYVTALGAQENPKTTNERQLHVNLGASQFHLLLQYSYADGIVPVTVAQVWSGHIELWSNEPLAAIVSRLESNGSDCTVKQVPNGNPFLLTACPWGNKFIIRTAPSGFKPELHGGHPGGSNGLIAMTRVVHLVPAGVAKSLHAFWSGTMGAVCELVEHEPRPGEEEAAGATPLSHCLVRFSSGQQLIFDEKEGAKPVDAYDIDEACAYHICLYVDHVDTFAKAFEACEAEGRLYANPRFAKSPPQFGNAMSWDTVQSCGQFRIKDLGAPPAVDIGEGAPSAGSGGTSAAGGGGGGGLVLEVEVRSVSHVSCPLTRADRAAGGVQLDVPEALSGASPFLPPPHAKPGQIRIPHGRGGFGDAAKELAQKRASPEAAAGAAAGGGGGAGNKSKGKK